jgi:hypothetical protein
MRTANRSSAHSKGEILTQTRAKGSWQTRTAARLDADRSKRAALARAGAWPERRDWRARVAAKSQMRRERGLKMRLEVTWLASGVS